MRIKLIKRAIREEPFFFKQDLYSWLGSMLMALFTFIVGLIMAFGLSILLYNYFV